MAPSSVNTRRWARQQVDLQVYVVLRDGDSRIVVPGRLTEISKGGMALYAGIQLQPGDLLEVEFPKPNTRVSGTVRSREGYCFGVEFVTSLSAPKRPAGRSLALFQQRHEAYLRESEQEISRMQKEVAALRRAALLAEEIKKL
ncbi:MAG: PilZ domain-containing protein [Terriglobales bacterium]